MDTVGILRITLYYQAKSHCQTKSPPGWQALKRATGIDVAKKIIEYVAKLVRK